ncbi:MAG: GTPase Era [Syntrophaceae bacterium CG2_30_49_12]|nr:MAG: GTPase Era [Syntrophaceae bacterium CG2_30_49_12]PIP04980.1 MAG: GTPase Era [Syntrophobacterales bacterium CG23_combo_of_CG06-09_8_20_14_all_48_27]PJA49880.1 MAG: GTPase Era [Syntrophobacterales bacterium CG_4_9_14_3_um_filter_49_8]PJC75087.1 MAG: GTPase Era [Syntrophobacterales bacterium CG_4_8_14_3_um_filter_49_14]
MFKSGFIGIIGRPNVGKSTLLNSIIGEKIAIVTPKPQTTRNRITGIKNLEEGQFVFLDTPGIHKASTPLNQYMVGAATAAFRNVDLFLLLVEANTGVHQQDPFIIKSLQDVRLPVILVINKIDLVKKHTLLPIIDQFRQLFPFHEIIPISALTGDGVQIIIGEIWKLLPEGPRYFPEDMVTDCSERFIAAEIIREKITFLTHQEVPYATAVVVDIFRENGERSLIYIQATINCEKNSQKGILIGKKGAMLKEIGTQARKEMERFFAVRIYLELFVRVRRDWTRNERMLREFGYTNKP